MGAVVIRHTFAEDDDPLFDADFVIVFPANSEGDGLHASPGSLSLPFPNDETRRSLTVGHQADNPGESQPCGRRCRPNWNAHSDGLRSSTAQDARERSNPERHPRSSGGLVKHDAEHQGYARASLTRSRGRRDL